MRPGRDLEEARPRLLSKHTRVLTKEFSFEEYSSERPVGAAKGEVVEKREAHEHAVRLS